MKKTILLLIPLLLAASSLFAQTAEEILDNASTALGGMEAIEDIQTMVMFSTIVMPNGYKGKISTYTKEGGKLFVKMNIDMPGISMETTQGCDGKDCYSNDPNFGMRLLGGQEKEMMFMQNDYKIQMDWRKLYTWAEYLGEGEAQGKKAHLVYLETSDSLAMTNYYDTETYLLLKTEGKSKTPMGEVAFVMNFYDYKDVHNGFKIPMRNTMTTMNQTIEMAIDEIEVNVPIPDDKFALPEGLK